MPGMHPGEQHRLYHGQLGSVTCSGSPARQSNNSLSLGRSQPTPAAANQTGALGRDGLCLWLVADSLP